MKNGASRLFVTACVLSLMWLPGLCDVGLPKGKLIQDDLDWLYAVGEERVLLSRKEIAILKNAESGNVTSQYEFAEVLNPLAGEGDKVASPRIAVEAFAWAMCSARRGYAGGENFVGLCYTFGNGAETNMNEGVRYLKRALRHGFPNAKLSLAKHYMATGDFVEALSWAQKSADEGDSGGMRLIGSIYIRNDESPTNKQLGVAWLQKSIDNGDPVAMNLLADCYLRGNGVASNQWEAVRLYELAAEQTNSFRQATLARVGLFNIYSAQGTANPESRRLAVNAARSALRREDEEFLAQLGIADSLKSYVEKNSKDKHLELGEAVEISKKIMKIKYGGRKECTMCKGSDYIKGKKLVECSKCNGNGKVDIQVVCNNCKGTGFVIMKCGACGGAGKIRRNDPRRLDPFVKCKECRAKGSRNKSCPICLGKKKVDKSHTCDTCNGKKKVERVFRRECPECKYVYARRCLARLGYDADYSSEREVDDSFNGILSLHDLEVSSYTYDIASGNIALNLKGMGPDSKKIEIKIKYEIYTGEGLYPTKVLTHDSAFRLICYRWIIDLYEFANDSSVVGKGVSCKMEEDDDDEQIEMEPQEEQKKTGLNEEVAAPSNANESTSGNSENDKLEQMIAKRMKEIILPSISFHPPATIADAVEYFKQASRDYDRSDIPKDQRGLNFVLDLGKQFVAKGGESGEEGSGNDFSASGNTNAEAYGDSPYVMPLIPVIAADNVSLWDALKLVCRVTKFKFQIQGGPVVMVMPECMTVENWSRLIIDSDADLPRAQMLEKRMKAIILPSISFCPPATIADAVEYFKQASRDFDRPDIPVDQRGFNFALNLGRTPTSGDELPLIPSIAAKNISLWDALNMVCHVTKFVFKDSENSIVVMPEGMIGDASDSIQEILQSAEQGDAEAQCSLGVRYAKGEGVVKDYNEAVKWFRKAAAQANAEAQFDLGMCYDEGTGVKENKIEAVRWYCKAAEQGLAAAQYNLGLCYYNGEGAERDEREAVKWFRKAAEQGHANAQHALAVCYDMGRGVEQDRAETIKWLRKAAANGNVVAQKALERLREEAEAQTSYAGNPLRRWQFGSVSESMNDQVQLIGFHGFEAVSLGYTSQNRLWSICLTARKSSDSMVRALIKECNSCYSGIEWKVNNNYQGELFATGRKRDSRGQVNLFVAIIPLSQEGEANRIQANIINWSIKRKDDGDEEYRKFIKMSKAHRTSHERESKYAATEAEDEKHGRGDLHELRRFPKTLHGPDRNDRTAFDGDRDDRWGHGRGY